MATGKGTERGLADFVHHEAGSIVWNASLVLLNHLRANHATDMRGKRVLELGAGIGHLAWGKISPLNNPSPLHEDASKETTQRKILSANVSLMPNMF